MSRYKDAIFQYIMAHPGSFRSELVKEFDYLSKQTVYKNISKLIEDGLIRETDLKQLEVKIKDETAFKFHPLISQRRNVSPIANAYYKDSRELKTLLDFYLTEHGEAMGKFFIDLFYLFQAVAESDAETNDEVHEINYTELKAEVNKIINAISFYEKGFSK